jgi:hypothetical protein
MFMLFSAAVIAVGVVGVLATLRRWERMPEEETEE